MTNEQKLCYKYPGISSITNEFYSVQLDQVEKTLKIQRQQLSSCETELQAGQQSGRQMGMELNQSGKYCKLEICC